MKIIVIGAVAAGTSAAAKARRNNPEAKITIYEKDQDISYAGCGLPYYLGGKISNIESLAPRNTSYFKLNYNVNIFIRHTVLNIDRENKSVSVKNNVTGDIFIDYYDKLIISTGAYAFIPPIKGIENKNVFFLRNVQDAIAINSYITSKKPQSALIIGSGFVGLEVMENLIAIGIHCTIIERATKLTPNLDPDMSNYLEELLIEKGVSIEKNATVIEFTKEGALTDIGTLFSGELLIVATGVKPNVELAKDAGLVLGSTGAIRVDEHLMTIDTNIYACGDCIETWSTTTKKPHYRPLGSTANKTGRICGDAITGGTMTYHGNLGTGILKVFDLTIGSTGLSETEALQNGYDIIVCHDVKPSKPEYMGGRKMTIKTIAEKKSQKILGVQIIGYNGVDKRLDIFVTLITYGAKISELFNLDLAYAPPFSTTKDPIHYTGMILNKMINK